MNQFPISYQTVDIIPWDGFRRRILLGRKSHQTLFRFIGGFVDVKDKSLEEAARRELNEEAGINFECSDFQYLFSFRVNDDRYLNKIDKILTAVFKCDYIFGPPKAGDDIIEVKWFSIDELERFPTVLVVPAHQPICAELWRLDA